MRSNKRVLFTIIVALVLLAGVYFSLFRSPVGNATRPDPGATGASSDPATDTATELSESVRSGNVERTARLIRNVNAQQRNRAAETAIEHGHEKILTLLLDAGVDPAKPTKSGATLLHLAAQNGAIRCLSVLLERGASIEARDKDRDTPLHVAVRKGQVAAARKLIGSGSNLAATSKQLMTPLLLAVKFDHPELVSLLIEKGADLRATNYHDESALALASEIGSQKIIDLLLTTPGLPSFSKDHKYAALRKAVQHGHISIVETLLVSGVDTHFALKQAIIQGRTEMLPLLIHDPLELHKTDSNGDTLLHFAAAEGTTESVTALLDMGLIANVTNRTGETPLHHAAKKGRANVIDALVSKGADVEFGRYHQSPLSLAAEKGHLEAVLRLLGSGADPNFPGHHNPLARSIERGQEKVAIALLENGARIGDQLQVKSKLLLHRASERNNELLIRRLVSDWNFSPRYIDANDGTPLHTATRNKAHDAMRTLLELGADVNAVRSYGETPLKIALGSRDKEALRILITAGADVNRRMDEMYPLEYVVASNEADIARMFIQAGAKFDNSILFTAIKGHCLDCVNLLIDAGADPNVKDGVGRSVIEFARQNKWDLMVRRLEERGVREKQ